MAHDSKDVPAELNRASATKKLGVDFTCANCMFCIQVRPDPMAIKSVNVCKRMPPSVQLIALPGGGHQATPVACVVVDSEWCFQYHPRPAN